MPIKKFYCSCCRTNDTEHYVLDHTGYYPLFRELESYGLTVYAGPAQERAICIKCVNQRQLAAKTVQLEQAQKQVLDLQNQLAQLEQTSKYNAQELQTQIKALEREVQTSKTSTAGLRRQIQVLRKKVKVKPSLVAEQKKLHLTAEQLANQIAANKVKQQTIENLAKKLQVSTKLLDLVEQKLSEHQAKILELNTSILSHEQLQEQYKKQIIDLQAKLSGLEQLNKELKEQNETLNQDLQNIAFKKLFGIEENKDLLISLVNSIVSPEDQVAELTLLNPYNPKHFFLDKLSILDIKAQNKEGKLYTEQLKKSAYYAELNKAIGIHILNFTSILESPKYHNVFHITEKELGFNYFKDLELHNIELKKFTRNDLLDKDNLPISLADSTFKKALTVLEKAEIKAITKEQKRIAKNLLDKAMPTPFITEVTGLTQEEVEELKILDLKSLINTRNFLADIIQNACNDYEKAGAIQAFEVCYELAKNTVRKVLLFRLAALEGLIKDPVIWFDFAKQRNKTIKTITRMLQLEEHHYQIVKDILSKYPYHFYAYGSRVKGTARKFSDLDICYKANIPDATAFLIEEEFKESDLPFTVELVYYNNMKPSKHRGTVEHFEDDKEKTITKQGLFQQQEYDNLTILKPTKYLCHLIINTHTLELATLTVKCDDSECFKDFSVVIGCDSMNSIAIMTAIDGLREKPVDGTPTWLKDLYLRYDDVIEIPMIDETHPNVCGFHGKVNDSELRKLEIELEEGNLERYLCLKGGSMSWKDKFTLCLGIVEGFIFLHSKGIVIKDLSDRTILVVDGIAKITDYSFRKDCYDSDYGYEFDVRFVDSRMLNLFVVDVETNVYSLRMIFWMITTRVKIIDGTPDWFVDLMNMMWDEDPERRPELRDVRMTINDKIECFGMNIVSYDSGKFNVIPDEIGFLTPVLVKVLLDDSKIPVSRYFIQRLLLNFSEYDHHETLGWGCGHICLLFYSEEVRGENLVELWKGIGCYEIVEYVNDLLLQGALLILYPPNPMPGFILPPQEAIVRRLKELVSMGVRIDDESVYNVLYLMSRRLQVVGNDILQSFIIVVSNGKGGEIILDIMRRICARANLDFNVCVLLSDAIREFERMLVANAEFDLADIEESIELFEREKRRMSKGYMCSHIVDTLERRLGEMFGKICNDSSRVEKLAWYIYRQRRKDTIETMYDIIVNCVNGLCHFIQELGIFSHSEVDLHNHEGIFDRYKMDERPVFSFLGGTVKELKETSFFLVPEGIFDFNSLYPSIIIQNNIGFFTYSEEMIEGREYNEIRFSDKSGTEYAAYYDKNKDGLIPLALKELVKLRKEAKVNRDRSDEPLQAKYYDVLQESLKRVANSFYGQLSARSFFFSNYMMSSSVTVWGRKYLVDVASYALDRNDPDSDGKCFVWKYADTDSIFISLGTGFVDRVVRRIQGFLRGAQGLAIGENPVYKDGIRKGQNARVSSIEEEISDVEGRDPISDEEVEEYVRTLDVNTILPGHERYRNMLKKRVDLVRRNVSTVYKVLFKKILYEMFDYEKLSEYLYNKRFVCVEQYCDFVNNKKNDWMVDVTTRVVDEFVSYMSGKETVLDLELFELTAKNNHDNNEEEVRIFELMNTNAFRRGNWKYVNGKIVLYEEER
ncbi:22870_t:CDS:10 [Gigaspora margarita]|uniref:DNA polymerase n=1 Tax=Gigaspora margarita TaxID=4874 RepID=A0ABM8VWS2_GIGMA|nr:22870_t:CDS:10 [Gigaspora margarita]